MYGAANMMGVQDQRMVNMQLAVNQAKARQEEQQMMADRFPTFYPRSYPGQVQGGMQGGNLNQVQGPANLNHSVGPVGSGRPALDRPVGPQRIVWPGA